MSQNLNDENNNNNVNLNIENTYIHHNNEYIYSNQNQNETGHDQTTFLPSNRNRFNQQNTSNNQTNPQAGTAQIQNLPSTLPVYPTHKFYLDETKLFFWLTSIIMYYPAIYKLLSNFCFAFLNGVFAYLVFNQISQKKNKIIVISIVIIFSLSISLSIQIYLFEERNFLVFMLPQDITKNLEIWHFYLILERIDLIMMTLSMLLKISVDLIPFKLIPIRERASYYSIIETTFITFRSLLLIRPWFYFIFNNQFISNDTSIPQYAVCLAYLFNKSIKMFRILSEFFNSLKDFVSRKTIFCFPINRSFGTGVLECPICKDYIRNPIELKCQHIFCESCIFTWLDTQNTCPLCRSETIFKKQAYSDGSTNINIQLI